MTAAIVVIDTNWICRSPRLSSLSWQTLIAGASDWGVRVIIPKVVLLEAINCVTREWSARQSDLAKLKLRDLGVEADQMAMLAKLDSTVSNYGDDLTQMLARFASIEDIPEATDLEDLVLRAIKNRAPYSGKKSDYFRDTLIWLTVCQIAISNPKATVWFVSDNHTDFGLAGDMDDKVTYPFHPDLVEDLGALTDRVFYVRHFDRLVQHLAASHYGVSDDDYKHLLDRLDRADLERRLRAAITTRPLDPESIGLQEDTTHRAFIASYALDPHAIEFVDIATRRGAEGWSASFHAPIAATVEIHEQLGNVFLDSTKQLPLHITGLIFVNTDGTVLFVDVTSIVLQP